MAVQSSFSIVLARLLTQLDRVSSRFRTPVDADHYAASYGLSIQDGRSAAEHYFDKGQKRGYLPSLEFAPVGYAFAHPGVAPNEAWAHSLLPWSDPQIPYTEMTEKIDEKLLSRYENHSETPEERRAEAETNRRAAKSFGDGYATTLKAGSRTYEIVAPSADDFLNLLDKPQPVSFVKLPHGFWDILQFIRLYQKQLRNAHGSDLLSEEQLWRLAIRVTGAHTNRRENFYTENFANELFDIFEAMDFPDSLHLGLSFKGIPTADNRIWNVPDFPVEAQERRLNFLAEHFPQDATFWDGTLFKRWCISGDLTRVSEALKHRPILLIASDIFRGLGDELGWRNWRHMVIPQADSHSMRYRLLEQAVAEIEGIGGDKVKPVVISQTGGTLALWYYAKLHKRFPSMSFLDIGQGLNIWRLNDVVFWPWLTTFGRQMIENNDLGNFYDPEMLSTIEKRIQIEGIT